MIHFCVRNEDVRAFTAVAVHGIQRAIYHLISYDVHCDDANNSGHNDILHIPIITFMWYSHSLEKVCDVRMCYLLVVISVFLEMNIRWKSSRFQALPMSTSSDHKPNSKFICNNLIKVSKPHCIDSQYKWNWLTMKNQKSEYTQISIKGYPNTHDKNQHDAG